MGMSTIKTSGHPLADRRYNMAQQLYERGDFEAALDLIAQAEEIAPHWPALPFRRGEILMEIARADDAVAAFQAYLALDPTDAWGAAIKLALLGAQDQPETAPPSYIETLYDDYAPRFETALVDRLHYNVPSHLRDLFAGLPVSQTLSNALILDLGCGTGLAGLAFKSYAAQMEGVDISRGMLREAEKKQIYSQLLHTDIITDLRTRAPRSIDIVITTDVLIYTGALEELFTLIARTLKQGGVFIFSTQRLEGGETYKLTADHRYAHSFYYLQLCLTQAGMNILLSQTQTVRLEAGHAVAGDLVIAQRL